ncbi:MAG: hypothetical protein WC671_01605 [Candidatus Paceibacterota bacterium]|jgi:hypothetical protein
MIPKELFVKVSGSVFLLPEFINWVAEISIGYKIVICVGGGTQIKHEFMRRGWDTGKFGPLGRETQQNSEQYWIAREILEDNKKKLEELLRIAGVDNFVVEIPMINIGKSYRHINGDQYILAAYLGFHVLYIATLVKRVEAKKQQFAHLSKIRVKAF